MVRQFFIHADQISYFNVIYASQHSFHKQDETKLIHWNLKIGMHKRKPIYICKNVKHA